MLRRPLDKFALVAVLAGGVVLAWAYVHRGYEHNWTPEAIASTKVEGAEVVRLVTEYRARHGRLPVSLSVFGTLPAPTAGIGGWEFVVHGQNFSLRTNATYARYPYLEYRSTTGEWFLDQ